VATVQLCPLQALSLPGRRSAPDARNVFHAQRDGCSTVDWQERVAAALPRAAPVTYINVGANKGYRIPEFLGLWSQQPVLDHARGWDAHLREYAKRKRLGFLKLYSCGNCRDCEAKPPQPHNRSGAEMHLLELAPANRALLAHMIALAKLNNRVHLHQLAASNVTQKLPVLTKLLTGDERGTPLYGKKAEQYAKAGASTYVQAVALDDFVREQRLSSIYHVAIDTEGWDALVIEGMRETLAAKRVALLEFEVNNHGLWRRGQKEARTVSGTLHLLAAAGYSCFWLLTGSLLPASGSCWLDDYGGRPEWSNLVCAHEPEVLSVLDTIAYEGYQMRRAEGGQLDMARVRAKRRDPRALKSQKARPARTSACPRGCCASRCSAASACTCR